MCGVWLSTFVSQASCVFPSKPPGGGSPTLFFVRVVGAPSRGRPRNPSPPPSSSRVPVRSALIGRLRGAAAAPHAPASRSNMSRSPADLATMDAVVAALMGVMGFTATLGTSTLASTVAGTVVTLLSVCVFAAATWSQASYRRHRDLVPVVYRLVRVGGGGSAWQGERVGGVLAHLFSHTPTPLSCPRPCLCARKRWSPARQSSRSTCPRRPRPRLGSCGSWGERRRWRGLSSRRRPACPFSLPSRPRSA